jgi:hypothetical protein
MSLMLASINGRGPDNIGETAQNSPLVAADLRPPGRVVSAFWPMV